MSVDMLHRVLVIPQQERQARLENEAILKIRDIKFKNGNVAGIDLKNLAKDPPKGTWFIPNSALESYYGLSREDIFELLGRDLYLYQAMTEYLQAVLILIIKAGEVCSVFEKVNIPTPDVVTLEGIIKRFLEDDITYVRLLTNRSISNKKVLSKKAKLSDPNLFTLSVQNSSMKKLANMKQSVPQFLKETVAGYETLTQKIFRLRKQMKAPSRVGKNSREYLIDLLKPRQNNNSQEQKPQSDAELEKIQQLRKLIVQVKQENTVLEVSIDRALDNLAIAKCNVELRFPKLFLNARLPDTLVSLWQERQERFNSLLRATNLDTGRMDFSKWFKKE